MWVDPATGEVLTAHRRGAVVWPADSAEGVWTVDHLVELAHGGTDDPANLFAVSPRLARLKTEAVARFARIVLPPSSEGERRTPDPVASGSR
jgi:hypothetical protein